MEAGLILLQLVLSMVVVAEAASPVLLAEASLVEVASQVNEVKSKEWDTARSST